ncbi:MAG: hypothetical protein SFW36_20485 [Leptolyngbyaceae cyanobacterium bins.59]|nr:hypothetical protein [Leptolyngbyaceae cyanobacterium bins.59]
MALIELPVKAVTLSTEKRVPAEGVEWTVQKLVRVGLIVPMTNLFLQRSLFNSAALSGCRVLPLEWLGR